MASVFDEKSDQQSQSSVQAAVNRITKRSDFVAEKIQRLDAALTKYKEQMKRTRPGPARDAIKARAMRLLVQKKTYEDQREILYNQMFDLDQVSYATEEIKDAQRKQHLGQSSKLERQSSFFNVFGTCYQP